MALAVDFLTLHRMKPGFIMPNAWDAGSAIVLVDAGFSAIGTTSAGIAFSMGRQDYFVDRADLAVSVERMFARMGEIAAAVDVPVNADLEAGYGESPEDVAETVRMAIGAGLAGGNIEDKKPFTPELFDEELSVDRIAAARAAIQKSGSSFVLTARTDAVQWDTSGIAGAIRRCNRFREAGADCLFVPGVSDFESIALLAREVDGPLNMVMGLGNASGNARDWLAAGVQRVSLGGSIARAALGFVRRAAEELRDHGTITFAEAQLPHSTLNTIFAHQRRSAQ